MNDLLRILAGIVRRRLGPQDLPYSVGLLRGLVLLAFGFQWLAAVLVPKAGETLFARCISMAISLALPWLVLTWRQRQPRYVQTMSALLGTGLMFSLIVLALVWYAQDFPPLVKDAPLRGDQVFVSFAFLGTLVWSIVVAGHIWRMALDWPMFGGVALAIALFVLEEAIGAVLSPAAAAAVTAT